MTMLTSQHHSFDIGLASRYGIECAILIHHFQHWIRVNRRAGRNVKEGRCWTYQSRKEVQAHFPYLTFDEIRRTCEKLVGLGVLMTGNFNKSKVDKTLWYAFVDEKAFQVDEQFSNNIYERQNCPSKGKSASPEGKSATPIPDTKTDTKAKEYKEGPASPPPPSAAAEVLYDFFLLKIRERRPEFIETNRNKWLKQFDLLLRVDKRGVEEVKALILWASTHKWWKGGCLSPEKLRKSYDEMMIQMQGALEQETVKRNRAFALRMKEKYPEQMGKLSFDDKFAMNRSESKEIPFNLPEYTFKTGLFSLFGGVYHGA